MRRFLGILSGDLSIAVIALGLSMALWVAVSNERNPVTDNYFPTPLPVQVTGLGGDLMLLNKPEPVRVRVSAPRDALDKLQPESLQVSIDLADKGVGEHHIGIQVKASDPSVRVMEISPPTVIVRLDKEEQRKIPVRANTKGSAPFGFVARTPEVEPQEMTVTGPLSVIQSASVAVASVNLDGAKTGIDQSVIPAVQDGQGRMVESIRLDPGEVRVQVRIEEELAYRPLPVRTQITGTVASGYWVEGVTVEPAIVTVVGRRDVLQSLTAIDANPIDIGGLGDSLVRTVPLIAPSGAMLTSSQTATVRVSIAAVRGTSTLLVAPSYVGLAPGKTATSPSVQVTLSGTVPALKRVDPSQLKVTVDLTNLSTGTHSLVPTVVVPDGLTLVGISPDKLSVEIK
ncbi:MAG: hypothetical protein EPO21_19530 [Chloroflexota bacterium]|nr:MAG: hypothetical protein EPO21_19530 [Chloroflexota bacterium]